MCVCVCVCVWLWVMTILLTLMGMDVGYTHHCSMSLLLNFQVI